MNDHGAESVRNTIGDASKGSPSLILSNSVVAQLTPPSLLLQNSNHSSTQSVRPPLTVSPTSSIGDGSTQLDRSSKYNTESLSNTSSLPQDVQQCASPTLKGSSTLSISESCVADSQTSHQADDTVVQASEESA